MSFTSWKIKKLYDPRRSMQANFVIYSGFFSCIGFVLCNIAGAPLGQGILLGLLAALMGCIFTETRYGVPNNPNIERAVTKVIELTVFRKTEIADAQNINRELLFKDPSGRIVDAKRFTGARNFNTVFFGVIEGKTYRMTVEFHTYDPEHRTSIYRRILKIDDLNVECYE